MHLSVVGVPKDGAGDGVKMGTSGYLASVILPIFEHVHDITDLPKPIAEGSAFSIRRSGLRYRRADSYSHII